MRPYLLLVLLFSYLFVLPGCLSGNGSSPETIQNRKTEGLSPTGVLLYSGPSLQELLKDGDVVVKGFVPFDRARTLIFLAPAPVEAP